MNNGYELVIHEFEPVFDDKSRVLILGTIPSPKSREQGFYYGHPRNRFWKVLSMVFNEAVPESIEDKKALLTRRHIALWDVLASCEIHGAEDGSIRSPVPNDLSRILSAAPIQAICTTGSKASKLYRKYCLPHTGMEAIALASTSPANCRISMEELADDYMVLRKYLIEELFY